MVFGALIPSIYYDFSPVEGKDTFSEMASSNWGLIVLAGLVYVYLGIIICGKAGMMKEKQLRAAGTDPHGMEVKTEYKFALGMFVSIISVYLVPVSISDWKQDRKWLK
jgi:L-rhamnose-H+ transport protein